jgi:signal transduction histidine kinase
MKEALRDIEIRYCDALSKFLAGGGEELQAAAYDLGRQALTMKMGVVEMAALHQRAVQTCQAPGGPGLSPDASAAAAAFLVEALAPFELVHRLNVDANAVMHQLNESLEEQCRRIAQTLHDEAGQLLATVYLDLAELERIFPGGLEHLARMRSRLDQVREQLRGLSHELRPSILDDLGLLPALKFLADGFTRRWGLTVTVEGELPARLGRSNETTLYRIAQEALTNVARHANANRVTLHVAREPDRIVLRITDNGVGFDVDEVFARRGQRGLGLVGMKERLAPVQGKLEIVSSPRQGTVLAATIPATP